MADLLIIISAANSIKEKKDASHALNPNSDDPKSPAPPPLDTNNTHRRSSNILSFVIGIIAAYLSWQCNTYENRGVVEKILWAFLAYMFSIPFFIYYILIRSGQCSASKEKYKLSNPDLTAVGAAGSKKSAVGSPGPTDSGSESGKIAKPGDPGFAPPAAFGRSGFYTH
jgi:hypothetical protein